MIKLALKWTTGTTTHKRRKRFNAIVIQPETTLGDTLQSKSNPAAWQGG
jgi:hypothetical protein